jgi:hypothetical protein
MGAFISTPVRRIACSVLTFIFVSTVALWMMWRAEPETSQSTMNSQIFAKLIALPAVIAALTLGLTTILAGRPARAEGAQVKSPVTQPKLPFMAQVVGLQWLNPLQRKDYPTEWQLLWVLSLVRPNSDDDMLKMKPDKYGKLQAIGAIAVGNDGEETFSGFHKKYLNKLMYLYRDNYFSDSDYFYNAHALEDKSTWRELAGIHVEYALPIGKLDPVSAAEVSKGMITRAFDIGNKNLPNAWTRDTPPDVRVTMGGANAGFTSLSAALDYLQAHPKETVWVMNWDAPSFPPKDEQINENMVLLILAGPDYPTGRAPLAWLGYPAVTKASDYQAAKDLPPRAIQAWKAAFDKAAHNANKQATDIAYVIHDASNNPSSTSDRVATLARTLTEEVPEFDFMKQAFDTPRLLGQMGAGTALTDVALGIAYANHMGKTVLVAGTTDESQPTATMVVPPAVVNPIRHDEPWFRARGGNTAYLPWWGLRKGAAKRSQGYSR